VKLTKEEDYLSLALSGFDQYLPELLEITVKLMSDTIISEEL